MTPTKHLNFATAHKASRFSLVSITVPVCHIQSSGQSPISVKMNPRAKTRLSTQRQQINNNLETKHVAPAKLLKATVRLKLSINIIVGKVREVPQTTRFFVDVLLYSIDLISPRSPLGVAVFRIQGTAVRCTAAAFFNTT